MIAIVDYGVGNLFSLSRSLAYVGADVCVTGDREKIKRADKILLPGVGAFGDAIKKLRAACLDEVLVSEAKKGKPILGICLGMQLLFDKSFEYGEHTGLGLIKGEIRPIADKIEKNLKVPHIGWNSLSFPQKGRLFEGFSREPYVYFVHSYYLKAEEDIVTARTEYGVSIDASVEKGNLFACQFHPEKSSEAGLKILENFVRLGREGN